MEEIFWHIKREEDQNLLEALYIDLLVKFAERKLSQKYKTILDVACGNGRLHKYLRELGYEVWGIDINDELLEKAKQKNKGFESYYIKADMRDFDLKREFDVVLSWFTSFGYFSDEENLKVLQNFKKHLRSDGILISDIPTETFLKRPPFVNVEETEYGVHVIYSWSEGIHRIFKDEIWKDGKKIAEREVKVRVYPIEVLKSILTSLGFEIMKVLERYSIRNLREGNCIILARKV